MTPPLDQSLVRELDHLLSGLIATNEELAAILSQQDELLVAADAVGLQASAQKQSEVVERLQSLLSHREAWLNKVRTSDPSVKSISDWVQQVICPQTEQWREQLSVIKKSSDRVRRQSWRQWVVVQGAHRHQSELLHLIARNGRKTVGYGPSANPPSSGGAILDASA
ncbi:flagellar export chaperone FlgN [Thalassoroseus pseudoceratinae]|uniref:flagellar export chaperone FlgN n=1 Tax=Thalassoroseus pseudoceratinae TaxID=2713176 RepID=UPI0014244920|nr:flagellar export chaperone FlgN [Thalassoroseus pseudoceratinae]